MKTTLPEKLERGRLRAGRLGSDASFGPYGAFEIQGPCGAALFIMATAGFDTGWEHVSVSTTRRPPNWQEMCWIKDAFWNDDECVVQYHPPKSDYINNHPHCLHLWRPVSEPMPRPPAVLVGVPGKVTQLRAVKAR
jgi:hypothetical protein